MDMKKFLLTVVAGFVGLNVAFFLLEEVIFQGYLETDLFVFPEDRLIVVRTQSPKAGFSGKPEGSEGYRKRALVLFKKMVNK